MIPDLSMGISVDGLSLGIRLSQQGIDRFTVQYGKQISTGLTYDRAFEVLGACIMHALSCEGKIDNREVGEV